MSWTFFALPLASADWWDTAVKVIAAVAVLTGPALVVWLTRRGNRADRTAAEHTEVEKLYIAGSQDLASAGLNAFRAAIDRSTAGGNDAPTAVINPPPLPPSGTTGRPTAARAWSRPTRPRPWAGRATSSWTRSAASRT